MNQRNSEIGVVAKGKAVRFSSLVESSGSPEVMVLWADPKKDKSFMQLVAKKRVATIVQKPTGNKTDHGFVGFHPQPFAVFMVFPKSVKAEDGAPIVGIKYELLKTPPPGKLSAPKIAPAPELPPAKPIEKKYRVHITRTLNQELAVGISASSVTEARKNALANSKETPLPPGTVLIKTRIVAAKEI